MRACKYFSHKRKIMENENIIQKLYSKIEMPKKLIVGDPCYFDMYSGKKLKQLTYIKNFRSKKDWVGSLTLKEIEEYFDFNGEKQKYTSIKFDAIFARNNDYLKVYEEGMKYSNQREKRCEIGVDSAKYVLSANENQDIIKTGSDGYQGSIIEFYADGKLEGITISMFTGDCYYINRIKNILEYVFSCNIK